MTLFDIRVPWITLWQSDLSIRIRIAPPASEGYFIFSVVPLGANGPVSPRRRAVCLVDSAGEPPPGDKSTRSVVIRRAMGHTMYFTTVDKCAKCGVMYSITTVDDRDFSRRWQHYSSSRRSMSYECMSMQRPRNDSWSSCVDVTINVTVLLRV